MIVFFSFFFQQKRKQQNCCSCACRCQCCSIGLVIGFPPTADPADAKRCLMGVYDTHAKFDQFPIACFTVIRFVVFPPITVIHFPAFYFLIMTQRLLSP